MIDTPCVLFPFCMESVCTVGERKGLDHVLRYNEELRVNSWITRAPEVYVLMMGGVHTAVWSRMQSPTVEIKCIAARCVAIISNAQSVHVALYATTASRRTIGTRFMHRYLRKKGSADACRQRKESEGALVIQLLLVGCSSLHTNMSSASRSSVNATQPG